MSWTMQLLLSSCLLAITGITPIDPGPTSVPAIEVDEQYAGFLGTQLTVEPRIDPREVPPFARLQGSLPRPVRGTALAGFGPERRRDSFTYVRHPGVTYSVRPGTRVQAIAPGIVRYVGELYGYGWVVIVDHGSDFHSVYGFTGDCLVTPGELIEARSPLGRTRDTGPQGERVYFEIRHRGEPLDPADWIDIRRRN